MKCPQCNEKMKRSLVEDITIYDCLSCRGMWCAQCGGSWLSACQFLQLVSALNEEAARKSVTQVV
jgi:Zn-finger nucleic acid-binding protein